MLVVLVNLLVNAEGRVCVVAFLTCVLFCYCVVVSFVLVTFASVVAWFSGIIFIRDCLLAVDIAMLRLVSIDYCVYCLGVM